jgi:hypothetical protein
MYTFHHQGNMCRPPNGIIHIGALYFVRYWSLIFVKMQPYFGLILRVWRTNMIDLIESKCARSNSKHHGFLYWRPVLTRVSKVTSKTGLEIKGKKFEASSSVVRNKKDVQHLFPSTKLTGRHFRKMEEVLNGYVTNPNPTPTLTPNLNGNSNPNPNQINWKNPKRNNFRNRSNDVMWVW